MRDLEMLLIKCDDAYNVNANIRFWDIINTATTAAAY